ncbi:MAG: hypothetical protein G01um101416_457 [Microgenomates group bacterium Gr01-1014_16]|nr:MAG: hypothetical protein G01um101416_457 [Microgenomates group bacterium Gr01-1014_16]
MDKVGWAPRESQCFNCSSLIVTLFVAGWKWPKVATGVPVNLEFSSETTIR